jgi:hypothetical protein
VLKLASNFVKMHEKSSVADQHWFNADPDPGIKLPKVCKILLVEKILIFLEKLLS